VPWGDEVRREAASSGPLTYDDFVKFPDDGNRHEIIGGEHYVTPSPNTRHQSVSMNLTRALILYLERHPRGRLFAAPFDVGFSHFDVVEPDLIYISRERTGVLTSQHVRGAPDLVIEILSPGTKRVDELTKRSLYERFGVLEYWVVDPERERMTVYRQSDGRFIMAGELSRERQNVLESPLLSGLSIQVTDVFATGL
jgi:Uma2 family endonuclease